MYLEDSKSFESRVLTVEGTVNAIASLHCWLSELVHLDFFVGIFCLAFT